MIYLVGFIELIYALFAFSYPPSFYNDDSLFLARGVENFCVVDFSPHFPAYPFFILLARVINFFLNDAKISVFTLSIISSLAMLFVLFLLVNRLSDTKSAFVVFLLSITSVYILNISLSMLSDSLGLFFIILSIYMLELSRYRLSSISFGVAFLSRPSYIPIILGVAIYVYFFKKEYFSRMFLYFSLLIVLFLAFMYVHSNMLYFKEGARFIYGHFMLWGSISGFSWFENIFCIENLPYIFALFFIRFSRALMLYYIIFVIYFLWVILAQNPENIRHIVPLIILLNILIHRVSRYKMLVLLMVILNLYNISKYKAKLSPIEQIATTLARDGIVVTNKGVAILEDIYGFRVVDGYYKDSALFTQNSTHAYVITSQKPKKEPFATYSGRFFGDRELYLSDNHY